jgi:hypothetical protein
MNKLTRKIFTVGALLLLSGYLAAAWCVMRTNIDVPILAIITYDSYPVIPRGLAEAYLSATDYDPNASTRLGMPAFNFIVAGYGLRDSRHNEAVLELSQRFIEKGADINKKWDGFTPLQAAVLANEPVLVQHLLKNNADQNIRLKRFGKPDDNMTTLEFAEYLAGLKKRDMTKVLELLKAQHNPTLKPTALRDAAGVGLAWRYA